MIKTVEVIIAVVLLLMLVFFAIAATQPRQRGDDELRTQGEEAITQIVSENAFRESVLGRDVDAVKTALTPLIQSPFEVQLCSGLGASESDCTGSVPTAEDYTTVNYLVSSTQADFNMTTLRLYLWLFK